MNAFIHKASIHSCSPHSFTQDWCHSHMIWFVHSSLHSFVPSFMSFTIDSSIRSSIYTWFIDSCYLRMIHLIHLFIPSFLDSFIHLHMIHWFCMNESRVCKWPHSSTNYSFIHALRIYFHMIHWSMSFEWRNNLSFAWMCCMQLNVFIYIHVI